MPRRQLTDADRARAKAYLDAVSSANIPWDDPERAKAIGEEIEKAHPIEDWLREAYGDEMLAQMNEPLQVLDEGNFLMADAPWGLVLYRVSYSDDTAWERMVGLIRESLTDALSLETEERERQLISRHDLVVIDDRSKFSGASVDQVRDDFNNWATSELQRNLRPGHEAPSDGATLGTSSDNHYLDLAGPRYNFCLVFDDICLESLDKMETPVIKLVRGGWTPNDEDLSDEVETHSGSGWEGGKTNSEFEDVGWMYIEASDYADVQNQLEEAGNWVDFYLRPPQMRFCDFDDTPGFWRRNRS